MTLAGLTFEFSKDKRSLKEISIDKLKQELPLDRLLLLDRAAYCVFDATPIAVNSRMLKDNLALWGGAMGIYPPLAATLIQSIQLCMPYTCKM
jgi:hypothetical protein